jgi:acyl-CoA reductase-like NAD-dependent aldehyde dehydrogenase
MKMFKHWISGSFVEPAGGRYFADMSPVSDSHFADVAQGNQEDVNLAVAAAEAAFASYRRTTAKDREAWLQAAASILERRQTDVLDILIDEIGSPISKARFEFAKGVTFLRAAAGMARQVKGATLPSDTPGRFSFSTRRPLGVIAAITPFNVPLIKGVRLTANALAVGNTVVLLPSELAPGIACVLAEVYQEAGIPDGAFNVVTGYGAEIGDFLTTHPAVKMVTFTGSSVVGQHIAGLCAQRNKRFTLELGGKGPVVVLADADLDLAVKGAIAGLFTYQGQVCMGGSRIYVQAPVYEEFCARFAAAASALGRGDLRDPGTVIGPIISDRQRQRVASHIKDAIDKGARVLTGGTWEGTRCLPTVLTHVTPDMLVHDEETFGPVAAVYPVSDLSEALERANSSDYGLSSSIFTRDLASARYYWEECEAGMVHVNAGSLQDEPHVPFGGTGLSGFGREGTEADIEAMTELKWVTVSE